MNAKIVIASTLKPVIDPRAYEKIGKSLADKGAYDVHIIGSYPTLEENQSSVSLYPIKINAGNLITRLALPWKILQQIKAIRPDLLIVSTHELLLIGVIYKLYSGTKLIYDIQENYYFNLIYQKNYNWLIRHFMAIYIRLKEILLSRLVNHFLLAEKCYTDEIKFMQNRYTIIENKYQPPSIKLPKKSQKQIELLLSGTISREYGVFTAIDFFKRLPPNKYRLVIIGHCANSKTFYLIKQKTAGEMNIDFKVSKTPIPPNEIRQEIGDKTIGILPYLSNKSTINKVPTKVYEYIGMGIPVLISKNPTWDSIVLNHGAGRSIDFNTTCTIDNISTFFNLSKPDKQSDLKEIMWFLEETKLLKLIKTII